MGRPIIFIFFNHNNLVDTALPREQHQGETLFTFSSSSGLSTPAILAEPSVPTNLGVILCHGFLSDKNSRTNRRLTELLIPRGIAALRFDWYGMGESPDLFSNIRLKHCEEQLDGAFQTLQERGINRIGLVGSSFGGFMALHSASKQQNLHALGLKCPVVDFPEVLRLEFGEAAMERWKITNRIPSLVGDDSPIPLNYSFYEECLTYDTYAAISRIHIPTLVVHGDQDTLIPRPQIDRLVTTLNTRKQLKLIEGADHQFGRPEEFRLMTNHLAKWIVHYLSSS